MTFRNSFSVGSGNGVTYNPSPTSVTRNAEPGLIFLRSQKSLGNSTCRFGDTLIVVVMAADYFIASTATSTGWQRKPPRFRECITEWRSCSQTRCASEAHEAAG